MHPYHTGMHQVTKCILRRRDEGNERGKERDGEVVSGRGER